MRWHGKGELISGEVVVLYSCRDERQIRVALIRDSEADKGILEASCCSDRLTLMKTKQSCSWV